MTEYLDTDIKILSKFYDAFGNQVIQAKHNQGAGYMKPLVKQFNSFKSNLKCSFTWTNKKIKKSYYIERKGLCAEFRNKFGVLLFEEFPLNISKKREFMLTLIDDNW